MKKYRKLIQKRLRIKSICAISAAVAMVCLSIITLAIGEKPEPYIQSVAMGIFCGLEGVCIVQILQYRKLLRDNEALEAMQIAENDERNINVVMKSSWMGIILMIVLLASASIVAAFINKVVFYTLAIVMVVTILLFIFLRSYYKRK